MRRLWRYGGPGGLQIFLEVAAFTVFLMLVGRVGEVALAATTLAGRWADAATWLDRRAKSLLTSSAFASAPVPWVAAFLEAHPVGDALDEIAEKVAQA